MPRFEEYYKISSFGRVISLPRIKRTRGSGSYLTKERQLKITADTEGYARITLYSRNPKDKIRDYLHRAVAEVFVANPENKPQVNHRDGDKLNNAAYNLEWATCKENINHAHENGLVKERKGESNGFVKLTAKEVLKIRELHSLNKHTPTEIGRMFNTSRRNVSMIVNRVNWQHI